MILAQKIVLGLAVLTVGYIGFLLLTPTAKNQTSPTPSTQKLSDSFATDGVSVYAVYSPILDAEVAPPLRLEGIDAKTFKTQCALEGLHEFACDSAHLINPGLAVVVSGDYDLASLQKLGGGYFKDKDSVYRLYRSTFMGKVEGADVETFHFVGNRLIDAQDKNSDYYCGKVYNPNDSVRTCY